MKMEQTDGMRFWSEKLGAPRHIVAPMVDASELAWRLLSRRYGAQLCYTPMLHSSVFIRDSKYRRESLASCEEDRPLIVQFCGNDPKVLLEAGLLAQDHCDAIDINLGCPQAIAKRGHYGAFLQDEWDLLRAIVSTLSSGLRVPVTCKIRALETVDRTVEYARMLEDAGCQILTVHGRTRDQKGPLTGVADWHHVTAVRKALRIPVISNGNVQCVQDVERCLQETGAHGVMTAEGNLYNPALFTGTNPPVWEPALSYLRLVEEHPCPHSYIRGHLFKLFQQLLSLPGNSELRVRFGEATTLEEFKSVVEVLRDRHLPEHEGQVTDNTAQPQGYDLTMPPWLCQSYVRITPEEHLRRLREHHAAVRLGHVAKRHYEDAHGNAISRKRMKKLRRISRRPEKACVDADGQPNQQQQRQQSKRTGDKCSACSNTLGCKCVYRLCKQCCRSKCYTEELDCTGHRILVRTRRQMAKHHASVRAEREAQELGNGKAAL